MAVASISRRPVTAGAAIWLVVLAVAPAPLVTRLALVGPLVLVPRLAPAIAAAPARGPVAPAAAWPWLAVAAGALAAISLVLATGSAAAAALATPWLLLTLGGAATAVSRFVAWWRTPGSAPRPVPTVTFLAGLAGDVFLVAGAGFLLFDRMALTPLGFDATIGRLSIAHFSVAGFGLVSIAGLLAASGSRVAAAAVVGLVAGIPLTAAGWFIGTSQAAWPGATIVAVSGLLAAAALARRPARRPAPLRLLGIVAAGALGTGMVLAIAWSTGLVLGAPPVALEGMVVTHGVLNLGAVLAGALLLGGRPVIAMRRRPVRRTAEAGVALVIGACAALVVGVIDASTLQARSATGDPYVVASLVGGTVPAWLLARSRLDPRRRPVGSGTVLGLLAVVVGCGVVVSVYGQTMPLRDSFALPGLVLLGLLVGGIPAAAITIPCGLLWAISFRRPRRRTPRPAR
ncbi:MAG: YndJ family transporter [Chloroflexota bacterium]